jgi:hypothetical protein
MPETVIVRLNVDLLPFGVVRSVQTVYFDPTPAVDFEPIVLPTTTSVCEQLPPDPSHALVASYSPLTSCQ